MTLAAGSASAFNVIPAAPLTGSSFVPSQSYELESGKSGFISRQPIVFTSIERGGTENFLATLKAEFPESAGWNFLIAPEDLKGSFSVSAYYVFFNGTLGGGVNFDYIPGKTDPVTEKNTDLHWIQRIASNHDRRSEREFDKKDNIKQHGTLENRIVHWSKKSKNKHSTVPFYDVVPKGIKGPKSVSRAIPPHFEYDAGFNDPENEHQWSSEVYLASINKNDPKTVTIYNGVRWGWENKTIFGGTTSADKDLKVQP